MNWAMIGGCVFGAGTLLILWWCWINYRSAISYENAVRAYIGADHEFHWDECIYWEYYIDGRNAADCAREMVAVNCEQ